MKAKAPHKLNNTLVWLNGTHAASVTMGSIHIRRRMGGTWVDLVSQVRFLYTARKEQGVWKIVTMNCIYEQDSLLPVCAVPARPAAVCAAELPAPGTGAAGGWILHQRGAARRRPAARRAGAVCAGRRFSGAGRACISAEKRPWPRLLPGPGPLYRRQNRRKAGDAKALSLCPENMQAQRGSAMSASMQKRIRPAKRKAPRRCFHSGGAQHRQKSAGRPARL